MKLLNKQKGYALIIVLLTITIIGIFTPVIISKIMNSIYQFKKANENIQLNKLTDMGIIYVERTIDKASELAKGDVENWLSKTAFPPNNIEIANEYKDKLENYLNNYVPNSKLEIDLDDENDDTIVKPTGKYKINIIINSIKVVNKTIIKVNYTVTPLLKGVYGDKKPYVGGKTINLNYNGL